MTERNDIFLRQGETFQFQYTHLENGAAVDLTGYSARMSVRTDFGGPQYAYLTDGADADCGTLTLGGVAGTVTISMTAEQTRSLVDNIPVFGFPDEMYARYENRHKAELVYDLELQDGAGAVIRSIEGKIIVYREVTR